MTIPQHILERLHHRRSLTPEAVFDVILFEKEHFEELYGTEGAEAFRQYYRGFARSSILRKRYWEKRTAEVFVSAIGKRIIDIGCGFGTEAILLGDYAASVVGIDIDPIAIAVALRRLAQWGDSTSVQFRAASVFDFHEEDGFDVIFGMEMLHHLHPLDVFFVKAHELLRPGGLIILSEPNGSNPFIRARLFFTGHRGNVLEAYGHQQLDEKVLSAYAVSSHLEETGFNIEKLLFYRFFPDLNGFYTGKAFSFAEGLLERIPAFARYNIGYIIVARKKT